MLPSTLPQTYRVLQNSKGIRNNCFFSATYNTHVLPTIAGMAENPNNFVNLRNI